MVLTTPYLSAACVCGQAMEVDGGHGLRGMVASASVDGTAKLWDLGKRAEVQTFKGHAVRRRRRQTREEAEL